MDSRVNLIKNLMEADNFSKAETLLKELIQQYLMRGSRIC